MLRFTVSVCIGLSLVTACAAFAQSDFSADIVNLSDANNTFPIKIFSMKDKLRFQGQDRSGRTNSIMIVNLAARTSIVLIPQQQQYIESSKPQIPGQGVTFFQAKDVEDACAEWQKMAHTEKEKCHQIGYDAVNGRDTVKYESAPAKGESSFVWIDAKLHFPVKWKSAVGAGELRNLEEATQAAQLFEIPRGFTKRTFGSPAKKQTAQP